MTLASHYRTQKCKKKNYVCGFHTGFEKTLITEVSIRKKRKSKIFYGQEPPSGESSTTECGVNYQLLAVITEVAHLGTPSGSRPQAATDNSVRDGRSNLLVAPRTLMGSTP